MNLKHDDAEMKNTGTTAGLKILMVDDDEICLFIQKRVVELSAPGSKVQTAANGKIALELLHRAAADKQSLPDIILLDLQMPVMNGTEFMEAFRTANLPGKERIAIVLLTSSVWESDKAYAMSLGASHYLTKPFTVDSLERLLTLLPNKSAHFTVVHNVNHPIVVRK